MLCLRKHPVAPNYPRTRPHLIDAIMTQLKVSYLQSNQGPFKKPLGTASAREDGAFLAMRLVVKNRTSIKESVLRGTMLR